MTDAYSTGGMAQTLYEDIVFRTAPSEQETTPNSSGLLPSGEGS